MLSKSLSKSQRIAQTQMRLFGVPPKELQNHLKQLGITNKNVVYNPTVAELYEYAMLPEHMESPDPSVGPSSITETGALMCSSGSKTGRVPKDKRIVLDSETEKKINWGEINIPMSPENFDINKQRAVDFLNMRKRIFVID